MSIAISILTLFTCSLRSLDCDCSRFSSITIACLARRPGSWANCATARQSRATHHRQSHP